MSTLTSCVARAVVAPKAAAKRSVAAEKAAKPSPALPAGAFAAASLAATPAAFAATEAISQTADGAGVAVGGAVVVAGLGGLLIAADPNKRREDMMSETGGDEAASVRNYFDTEGFNRWKKIYGETDEVNKVQLDIRNGHQQTVDKILDWTAGMDMTGKTVCDAGCGTGSLAIPLALRGASVSASDISSAMVGEAEVRYNEQVKAGAKAPAVAPKFEALGLEECSGKYDMVTCIDVMIHYPTDRVNGMVNHLASLSDDKLIISFAPKTLAYSILKRIGELFPGPSKATRAYLHAEEDVEAALNAAGFKVTRREMTATSFYFSRLLECQRV
jgi:magnesium-protoporphyrin O-methyltransferase|tara:strand:- start:122 stop:1111 length:990 start_codon:yes stop_codon:yes gene_type:complete